MHTSTWPLLWWWYDDNAAHSMFMFLQIFANFSEIKLLAVSDICFLVSHIAKNFYMLVLDCLPIDLLSSSL